MNNGDRHMTEEEALRWSTVLSERVVFKAESLGWSGAHMRANEFRLPFPGLLIYLRKPYELNDKEVRSLSLIESSTWGANIEDDIGNYMLSSKDCDDVVAFSILDTGEIVIRCLSINDVSLEKVQHLSKSEEEHILRQRHENWLYNLVYDTVATVEYINSSNYVLTSHSTDFATGARLGNGQVQRRIKLRHKKTYSPSIRTNTGTKHRYKYRVRGHWREYEDGQRIWIKDHVRGGDGSIFIPKEYEL